jgi:hypothetical protein
MSLSLIHEVWKVVRPSIETGDIDEAAEMLVNYLVDNDYDTSEIKSMFKRDPAVQDALSFFMEKPEDGLYHEEEEEYFDEDYDEDDYDDDRY